MRQRFRMEQRNGEPSQGRRDTRLSPNTTSLEKSLITAKLLSGMKIYANTPADLKPNFNIKKFVQMKFNLMWLHN